MSTIIYLVRHAVSNAANGILVGRAAGTMLGTQGQRQASRLADRFAAEGITAVQTSPRTPACETAAIIAARSNIGMKLVPALDDVDYGEWTGRGPRELAQDLRWQRWHQERALSRCPSGESMSEVQERALGQIMRVHHEYPSGRVVMVSHAELIRSVLLYCLGLSLDEFSRIETLPASISTLAVDDRGTDVEVLNNRIAA